MVSLFCLSPFAAQAENQSITLQLKWKHAFQFAGYYMALEKGYYAKEGLDVTLIEGQPGQNAAQYTLDHDGAYAVTDTGALLAHANGKKIKALGAIFQHSPLALMVLKSSGINTIADLRGKRIMLQAGYQGADILAAMRRGAGITAKDFTFQKSSFDVRDLITGKTDAFSIYVSNQPYKLDVKSIPYRVFHPHDQGVDFYGDILITSKRELEKHPERAKAFMRATMQGWTDALENVDGAVDLIMSKYNQQDYSRETFMFEAHETVKLIRKDMVQIGTMNSYRWQHIAEVYAELGLMPKDYFVEDFIHQVKPGLIEIIKANVWQFVVAALLLMVLVSLLNIVILRRRVQFRMTKLAESQQDFRNLIELADIGMIVYRAGRLLFANPYVLERLGVDSLDDVRGKEILPFIHPDDYADVQRRGLEVMQDGASFHGISVRYVNANNECFDVEASMLPIHYEGELAVLTVALDLTERKRAAEQNARMQEKIEQTQRMESLGVLSGGIAHNFNNLLAVIMGHADLAKGQAEKTPDRVDEHLHQVIKASKKAAVLCQQMLAYSGKGQFVIAPTDLSDVLKSMKELLAVSVKDHVEVDYQLEEKLSLIRADSAQMQQVMVILISNASEAISDAGGRIVVRTGMMDADATYLNTCVHQDDVSEGYFVYVEARDTGQGMSAEIMAKIFEPFFTTKMTGRGLGMSALLGIMGAHDGAIHIDSTVGEGSCIRLLFPVMKKDS